MLSRLDGEITIDPPLTYQQLKESRFRSDNRGGDRDTCLVLDEEHVEYEDAFGVHTTITGRAITGRYEEAKCYTIETELEEFSKAFPDNTFRGYLVRKGEEQGDVARYFINQERRSRPRAGVTAELAEMQWPDGTPVK
jgi:hypothetical protein